MKTVLMLGANSDVAKECVKLYAGKGYSVVMASRNMAEMETFLLENNLQAEVTLRYFDAVDFGTHQKFYEGLPQKPNIVVYSAGFLVKNEEAVQDFDKFLRMAKTNYLGAVSILNIIANDFSNKNLERIIGLSSLSGVRGRKSNFIYGSTKSAFYHYLQGLRQELSGRNIVVNAFTLGYINTKINAGLALNKSLMMEPEFVAKKIVNAGNSFNNVPNFKWKLIYQILKILPEGLVKRMP